MSARGNREEIWVGSSGGAYPVFVGPDLMADLAQRIATFVPKARKVALVTDRRVGPLYAPKVLSDLRAKGFDAVEVLVPEGESAKAFAPLESLCDSLLEAELAREDLVVALGGGVVGDLAGFAASIVRRGLALVQVPTTLLAQVDSSVGGKTGINSARGKNLIGSFTPPAFVLADTKTLTTLPKRALRAGSAEVIKYALIRDAAFFDWIESEGERAFRTSAGRDKAIARSVQIKAEIVARDEREEGERAHLNLGHTFAHAIETEAGYGEGIVHGEAVAIGMALACRYALRIGMIESATSGRMIKAIGALGLPTSLNEMMAPPAPSALLGAMRQDKKIKDGRLRLILPEAVGRVQIVALEDSDDLAVFLREQVA